jgi:serine/threonine protein kinase
MTDDSDDPRVLSVAREYLAELEAGRTPPRAGYESRFPELRAAVAECLDGVELAHAAGLAFRPSAPPPAPDASPEPLGDFRIVREIGRGGMGVVYEAVQLSLGRRVALKVLPFAAGLDAKHLQRFKTEAHAAAQLHHTNIVPVYAVGQDRGTHYYAMQLIDGRPLDAVIRELRNDHKPPAGDSTVDVVMSRSTAAARPAPLSHTAATTSRRDRTAYATAARFAAQVADALEYAHDAGVVHRDIKPANLLLDPKGTVWVTDFGLAQVQAEANVTRTGDVFGTLRYSSPEQATGRRTDVDHRTDVYSLGATLYELLTLQPIFPDLDRQSLLYRIIHEEPVPPRQHDRAIPEELETIVLKAVAKVPAERYATAGELAADLRRFLDDRPILARRPTLLDLTRKWLRRHPAYSYAAVAVLLLAAVGFGISTLVVNGAKRQAEDAKKQTEDALTETAAAKHDAEAALARVAAAKKEADDALAREKQRAQEAADRFQIARELADEHIRVANEDLGNDPVQEGLSQRMLQTALEYYRVFIDLRKDDPTAVEDLKAVRDKVSGILADLTVKAGAGRLELLRRQDVQDGLKLGKVADEVIRTLDANRPKFDHKEKLTQEQVNARLLEHARKQDGEIRLLLNDAQNKRLDQIFLQARGTKAFDRSEVIAALKLTADDRETLRHIERQGFAKRVVNVFVPGGGGFGGGFGRGPGGMGGGPGGGRGKPEEDGGRGGRGGTEGQRSDRGPEGGRGGPPENDPHKAVAAVVAEMVAALKPEQQAEWKKLTGEPFEFKQQKEPWGGFGGPGGGFGGPGGGRPGGGR